MSRGRLEVVLDFLGKPLVWLVVVVVLLFTTGLASVQEIADMFNVIGDLLARIPNPFGR